MGAGSISEPLPNINGSQVVGLANPVIVVNDVSKTGFIPFPYAC
jgi:hypothetical protein